MSLYDVIVVGLGPAGSSAAYFSSKSGLSVLAIDKESFPRKKSCGGGVAAKVDDIFDFDLSSVYEGSAKGAVLSYRTRKYLEVTSINNKTVVNLVRRELFDELLLTRAREAGASVLEGRRVVGASEDLETVTLTLDDDSTYSARFVLFADGASGFSNRYLSFKAPGQAISITTEVPLKGAIDLPEVGARLFLDLGIFKRGYGWIFPKKDFLSVGVAADASIYNGASLRKGFYEFFQGHKLLKGLTPGALKGWIIPVNNTGEGVITRGRSALLGDAGALVDPFLGEGLYYAVRSGQMGAEAVKNAIRNSSIDLAEYQRAVESEFYPEFKSLADMGSLIYKHTRLWFFMATRYPQVMSRYLGVVAGTESPVEFSDWLRAKLRAKPWKLPFAYLLSLFSKEY